MKFERVKDPINEMSRRELKRIVEAHGGLRVIAEVKEIESEMLAAAIRSTEKTVPNAIMRIGGEAAVRIADEVLKKGILTDNKDTPEEATYRTQVAKEMDDIHAQGGTVILEKEWP